MLLSYSLLAGCALAYVACHSAHAQTAARPDTAAVVAPGAFPAAATGPSPALPWWLPNAQECAAIRAEEARTAPQQAQRREKKLQRWATEQPAPPTLP